MGAGRGVFVSASLCALVLTAAAELQRDPARLQARGGPLMLFAAWATLSLLARVWFGLLSLAQQQGFLDPRRLRPFPVSERLVSAINLMALLFDPVWLLLYPPPFCIAFAVARLPGAPAAASMLGAGGLGVGGPAGLRPLGAGLPRAFRA